MAKKEVYSREEVQQATESIIEKIRYGRKWMDDYLECKQCGDHILCLEHKIWLDFELKSHKPRTCNHRNTNDCNSC